MKDRVVGSRVGPAPSPPSSTDLGVESSDVSRQVLRHVEERAPNWLGQRGPASVVLRSVDDRTQSTQIRLDVDVGTAHRELVVKAPKAVVVDPGTRDRLVLPVSDPLEKSRLEYDALSAMATHFSSLGDPRFGWVDVYDHLRSPPAVVLGRLEGPTFDKVLRNPGRAGPTPSAVLRNLGAWLVAYHSLSTPRAMERDIEVTEVVEGMLSLVEAVSRTNHRSGLSRDLGRVIRRWVPEVLPSRQTLGLAHGDFAPRNVFVGPDARVSVIDSLGRFRAPIHEDLAYLLVELLTGAGRMRRWARPVSAAAMSAMRADLLAGYGVADNAILSVFELRALLDKWRSLVQRSRTTDLHGRSLAFADFVRRRLVSRRIRAILRLTHSR